MNPLFFKIVHYYVDKTESCRHVIFSPNCCFVANFVDKALVDDSTSDLSSSCHANPIMAMHVQLNFVKIVLSGSYRTAFHAAVTMA